MDKDAKHPFLSEKNPLAKDPAKILKDSSTTTIKPRMGSYTLTVEPNVDNLLSDALSVIAAEITRYKIKSNKGISLDLKESRIIQGYVKSLVDLSKESREREKQQDATNLSNEELLEIAAKFMANVKQAKDDKTINNAKIVGEDESDDEPSV